MSLFRLDASIMPAASQSRALADLVEAEWSAEHPDSVVTRRDIGSNPLPSTLWRDVVTSGFVAEGERSPAQLDARAQATEIADELINADALLLAVPLYNWGVAAHVKSWYDVAYADPRIAEGALKGKPAVLTTVLGGNYNPGTPKEGWDHSTPWLERVLGEVWGTDLLVVQRPFTLVGVNPAMDQFAEQAAEIKAGAEQLAIEYGRAIAAKRNVLVG
ncbi:FMN-dependent NADH-azoreductase [Paramicrobacterium fandaimingii]|uniref:FMN-dependent NADH-azoreductase n=1 Tax=Paramicrobacterium fandaimingii TaxID=2708079 RepID=UPI00141F7F95|nr:NAD(P)H-dependent oxidoreductase [Microbacterium fandaimingii]